ncbi:aminopeptidase P family protein [Bacillus sp. FJAT-42376]|uniref:M24 family metallopeptidase n=1 Tax=Bacillus sp. FJAT-42376 TaxID=2014076 RepID=UPI000F4D40D3|nr:Xaa-Pro peptidase family protein [Bacillus sp. FJAT-42376]AZB42575.1 aminopeptidase P family protein [Bacillus sp. FJAT-42376]
MNKRIEQLREWMRDESIDAAYIHSPENVYYLTNFLTDPHERLMGLFIFQEKESFFILPGMETGQAKDAGFKEEIIGYGDHENPFDKIRKAFASRGMQSIQTAAIESELLSYSRAQEFLNVTGSPKLVSAEEKMNELRVIKDEKEIAIMEKAARLADYGVEVGVAALKEGITEMDVVAKIEYELKRKGAQAMSFSTMVLFGKKSGLPHGNPGTAVLKKGDFVLFDLGVVLDGYCSDITRTVMFGQPDEKQKSIYHTVLEAELAALQAAKPGVRIGDLDKISRKVIEDAGYGEYFPHRLGHGLGISVHEFPSMAHTNDGVLKEGMTFTIEPGVYIPEVGGVRIEDDVLITKDGARALTAYPKELQIIE